MVETEDSLLGKLIAGRYHVVRRLGEGAMGVIYLATQEPLGRPVALKVLQQAVSADDTASLRFQREAQAVSTLHHPHIVTLYDFGHTQDGELFFAMEFLDGQSLREVVDGVGRLHPARALHIIRGIASGLVEAHRHGIMHRDLKPQNVMLISHAGDHDFPKLLDFGLARFVAVGAQHERLTQRDIIPGTPAYLPPERTSGINDDLRSDLYSLGALWFELLCGRPPFEAENPIKVILKHVQEPPPRPSAAGADPSLSEAEESLLLRLLAKAPEDRPPAAEALVAELDRIQQRASPLTPTSRAAPRARAGSDLPQQPLTRTDDMQLLEQILTDERLDASALEAAFGEEPIALTRRKSEPAAASDLVDSSGAAVVLLTKVKPVSN